MQADRITWFIFSCVVAFGLDAAPTFAQTYAASDGLDVIAEPYIQSLPTAEPQPYFPTQTYNPAQPIAEWQSFGGPVTTQPVFAREMATNGAFSQPYPPAQSYIPAQPIIASPPNIVPSRSISPGAPQPKVVGPKKLTPSATLLKHWRRQASSGRQLAYPTVRLNALSQVGDTGRGDARQRFDLIRMLGDRNYLMRLEPSSTRPAPVFLFRSFDLTHIPAGTLYPAPTFFEITGKHQFRDHGGAKRIAFVVEARTESQIPLPSIDALNRHLKLAAAKDNKPAVSSTPRSLGHTSASNTKTPAGKPSTANQPALASQSTPKTQPSTTRPSAGSKPKDKEIAQVSGTQEIAQKPKFEERTWHTKDGKFNAVGKLVGVGDDVIWLKVKGHAVIRMSMNTLSTVDRRHAIAKRQDILEYRRQQKEKKANTQ